MDATAAEAAPTGTEQPPPPPSRPSRSPYPGLRPFTEEDHAFFFGREREAEIVEANLLSKRLTLLYGASGVGKSSVLQAGVVDSLREQSRANINDEDAFNDFAVVVVNAWSDPQKEFAAAARAEIEALLGRSDLPDPPDGARLAEVLAHWSEQLNGRLLVVFDQFEEYFRYHDDELEPGTFDDEFPQAVNRADVRASFLVSIPDDELAQLDRFRGKIPSLFDNRLKIDHLSYAGAEKAIRGPIDVLPAEQRLEIAEGFVEVVLAECAVKGPAGSQSSDGQAANAIQAPALQLVLERLWRDAAEAGEHTLTPAQLTKLGGLEGIREDYVGAALDPLSPPEQEIVARCFSLLAGSTKTKVAYPASVLARMAGRDDEREVTAVLDKLCVGGTGRILTAVDTGQGEGSKSYELFSAGLLAEPVVKWQKEYDEEQRRKAEEERRRALRRKYRNRSLVLVALVAVFAALCSWAFVERHTAIDAKTKARSIALASIANTQVSTRPDISLLLSLAAYGTKPTVEAQSSMISALEAAQSSGAAAILHGHTDQITSVALSPDGRTVATGSWDSTVRLWDVATRTQLGAPLRGHEGTVNSIAFSPDGHTLASGSDDKTVRLWDVDTHKQRGKPLSGHKERVESVAFSPDGHTLATGSDDKTVRLWDVATHEQRGEPLRGYKGEVQSVAFSPDGRTLASGSFEASGVTLWNAREPTSESRRSFGAGEVWQVAFSPDGKTLATAGGDDTVRLWDVATRKQLGEPLRGHRNSVTSVAFSRDGRTLASGSLDKTVRLWDVDTHKQLGKLLSGHTGRVTSVAFSPAEPGTLLASGSFDTTVRLWDVSKPRTQLGQPLLGQKDMIVGLAFSPDGHTLATGSWDNTVWLWDVTKNPPLGKRLPGDKGDITSVAFSRDGHTLAVGERDGTVKLWDVVKNTHGKPLLGHKREVKSIAFSPDGHTLATGGRDGTVLLWDVDTQRQIGKPLSGRFGPVVFSVAFSPDGHTLATGGTNSPVRLWDVDTQKQLGKPLLGHFGPVYSVAFGPDGRTLATGGYDSTVRLWDVRTRTQLGQPLHHRNIVNTLAFSPDGRTLVTGDSTKTVRLWDVRTHTLLGKPLLGHKSDPDAVAFSPGGRKLATGDEDGTVVLWEGFLANTLDDLQTRVCRLVANLTTAEWQQFVPGLPYRTTCPVPAAPRGASSR